MLQKFRKNDMLQLVPERSEDYALENPAIESLQWPLIPESSPDLKRGNYEYLQDSTLNGVELPGQDLSEYPTVSRTSPVPKQTFDFAQYYAFNLMIFVLTILYSSFPPLMVPVGASYFGYRYVMDKYNFLFVYRVGGFLLVMMGR